jgi:hypothetical protein
MIVTIAAHVRSPVQLRRKMTAFCTSIFFSQQGLSAPSGGASCGVYGDFRYEGANYRGPFLGAMSPIDPKPRFKVDSFLGALDLEAY